MTLQVIERYEQKARRRGGQYNDSDLLDEIQSALLAFADAEARREKEKYANVDVSVEGKQRGTNGEIA